MAAPAVKYRRGPISPFARLSRHPSQAAMCIIDPDGAITDRKARPDQPRRFNQTQISAQISSSPIGRLAREASNE
ncbi:MAG: hypothetical protein ABIS51_15820, partial [Sphingomonas sp.]